MTRLLGWERRLFDLLEHNRTEPFKWGRHDCCTWAAAAVAAVSGQQISMLGKYATARGALRLVQKPGGLQATVTSVLGFEPLSARHAQRGDVVLLSQPGSFDGYALAVCFGGDAYAPGENGLVAIQMTSSAVLAAWYIGH